MTRNVRKYDAEFKRNAVSLYISSGKSYPVLGEELGIPAATLAGWVNSGSYQMDGQGEKKDNVCRTGGAQAVTQRITSC